MVQMVKRSRRQRVPLGRSARRLGYERRVRVLLALLGLPVLLLAALLLRDLHVGLTIGLLVLAAIMLVWAVMQTVVADQLLRPLQTLSNVVSALRENDFSFRARGARRGDALGDLALEINALANDLQRERGASLESAALVQRVLAVMDAPVFALNARGLLLFSNAAGKALLRATDDSALEQVFAAKDEQVIPLGNRQWVVRRSSFREGGVPHQLLLLADVSGALRDEEREAWRRLIRVLGHEINNSLTPIKSLAGSLRTLAQKQAPSAEFARPLEIIEERAASLNRFLSAYRELAQLPPPRHAPLPLGPFLAQLAALETRVPVTLAPGPEIAVLADGDQLAQALLNLLRNAAEASLENPARAPGVVLAWRTEPASACITVGDSGLGIANPGNLFVPFYTTKPAGTGIGLFLAKQIAEAHGGSVTLHNREGGGAEAELRLPLKNPTEEQAAPRAASLSPRATC